MDTLMPVEPLVHQPEKNRLGRVCVAHGDLVLDDHMKQGVRLQAGKPRADGIQRRDGRGGRRMSAARADRRFHRGGETAPRIAPRR